MGRPLALTGDRHSRALALYKSGKSIRQISEAMGESYGTLQRTVKEAGLSRPRGNPWPKGKPRGRVYVGGEPCAKGHPGSQTYDYITPKGRTRQICRTCVRYWETRRTRPAVTR